MARATRFLFAVLLSTAPFVASRAVVRDGLLRRQQNENTTATTNSSMALSSTSSTSDSSTDSSTTEDWAAKYPASAKVAEQCGHVETCAFAARVGTADGCLKSVSAARSCGNDCSSGSPKGIYPAEDVLAALKEAYHACGALGQCIDIIESFPNDERPDVCKSGEQQDNDRRTVRGSGAPTKPDPGNSPFRRISMMQAGSLSCSSSCVSVNAILAKEDPCQREFRAAFYDCRDCGSSDGSTATSTLGTAEDLLNAYKSYCISQGWSLVSLGFTEMKTDGAESTSGSDGVENSSGNDSQTAVDGSAPAQADNSEQPEGETSERSAGTGGTSPSSDSSGNPSGSPSPPPSTTSISLSVFASALVTSTASNGKLVTLTAPVALVTSTASNGDLFTLTSILPPVPSVSLADVTDVSGRIANTAVAAATPTQTSAAGKTLAVKGGAVLAAVLMAVIVL